MKKFISFVMTGAMVASLVPATAFAKGEVTATAKVVDSLNITKDQATNTPIISEGGWSKDVPELQLTITDTNYRRTQPEDETKLDVTVTLDGAAFVKKNGTEIDFANDTDASIKEALHDLVEIKYDKDRGGSAVNSFEADPTGKTLAEVDADDKLIAVEVDDVDKELKAEANVAGLKWLVTDGGRAITVATHTGEDIWYKKGTDAAVQLYDKTANELRVTPDAFVNYLKLVLIDSDGSLFAEEAGNTAVSPDVVGNVASGKFNVSVNDGASAAGTAKDVNATNLRNTTFDVTTAQKVAIVIANAAAETPARTLKLGNKTVESAGDGASPIDGITWAVKEYDKDQVTYTFTGRFAVDDIIIVDLCSKLDKTNAGKSATVSVDSNAVNSDDLVYVSVEGRGITATTRKVGSIAEEEYMNLESDIKVSSTVGDFADDQWFELKLSKGFEFNEGKFSVANSKGLDNFFVKENTAYVQFDSASAVDQDSFTIDAEDIEIESTSAKSGATCTMTIKALDKVVTNKDGDLGAPVSNAFKATTTVEIMKVVDYKVILSVDEDEDVPVIYSGVDVDNYGITDDSDHWSLEVTAKESFPGAWSMRKGFNFELPEHVYVADIDGVDVTNTENFYWNGKTDGVEVDTDDVEAAFWNAYREGGHKNFEFAKRVFDDVDSDLRDRECGEMVFKLKLVADPGFEGDVVLKLTGELVDEQEVVIAKFVKPYEVKAEQNDMIIDYRYTEIPTSITITETEKGLWAKDDATFFFNIEDNKISFDDDPTYEIDSKSDLAIKNEKVKGGTIEFTVKSESDEAATVAVKNMNLYMQRSIPAGPYDLEIDSTLARAYEAQVLFAPDNMADATVGDSSGLPTANAPGALTSKDHPDECDNTNGHAAKADSYVGCVADYSNVVKEAFVNVVTAGRDQDDASFTTKVVVPVGENYIVAGEKQIELDTPAYINAAGYTMLPIRAVAVALGINSNNVLWDQPTKTVTILYGQRIITMTQGQKVVYVNGSAIPASAAVENTNSRTFLPMRDLATALGVTDITWDQATRTATLNGNQK